MSESILTFSSKDWLYFFNEQLRELPALPFIWDQLRGNGLGENVAPLLGLRFYPVISRWILHNVAGLNWLGIELIIFFGVALLIGFYSAYQFGKYFFPKKRKLIFLTVGIFLLNTYILMIFGGGQLGVILAYTLAPLALIKTIDLIEKNREKFSWPRIIIVSLLFSLLALFDLRIAYIALVAAGIFSIFHNFFIRSLSIFRLILSVGVISFLVLGLLAFWFLPVIAFTSLAVNPVIFNIESVRFLSFASFSNVIALLHPNWPENIFGKIYFMRPEFLVIPILAYSSLLFIRNESKIQKMYILYFAFLGLVGAFLAKGTNPPLGEVYSWLFKHLVGFGTFRDATKWYLLIALSYSVLVPYTLTKIWLLIEKNKSKVRYVFLLFAIGYLLFLIHPLWLGKLSGTFRLYQVPEEYIELKNFLSSQSNFSRTLWIPQRQRFGYYSDLHPAVGAYDLFKLSSPSAVLANLEEYSLRSIGVKFVILPFDSQGELFLEDRKYSDTLRANIEGELDKISWLKKHPEFTQIALYELMGESSDLFSLASSRKKVNWQMINPTKFTLTLDLEDKDLLIFSQRYDSGWVAKFGNKEIVNKKIDPYLMEFEISEKGMYTITYTPQRYVYYGYGVSLLALAFCVVVLIKSRRKK